MARVEVRNLVKQFGADVTAVGDVSFTVEEGQVLTLLGPSGCGKSTILRCIAGLEQPTSGRIKLGDEVVFDSTASINVPVDKRTIGMVFQSYAIWPHLSVFQNVALPLKLTGKGEGNSAGKDQVRTKVREVLTSVGMEGYENRYPSELSGGQQQRVVLARSLVYRPRVLLLDEPLANLDAKLRESMRFEVREVQQRYGLTTIYVTHDQAEAMALSDDILVLKEGEILRQGDPRDVYHNPKHPFVADFLGVSNLLSGQVVRIEADHVVVQVEGWDHGVRVEDEADVGEQVWVAVRPGAVRLEHEEGAETIRGTLSRVTYLGSVLDCLVEIRDLTIRALVPGIEDWRAGATVHVGFRTPHLSLLHGTSEEVAPSRHANASSKP